MIPLLKIDLSIFFLIKLYWKGCDERNLFIASIVPDVLSAKIEDLWRRVSDHSDNRQQIC